MDQRERYLDEPETYRVAMEAWQTRIWTAIPGVIKQFPSASGIGGMVADIQPTVNGRIRTKEGEFQSIQMPLLLDCPVIFPGGGGVTLTFPIEAGDECLVIFSARCIDAWWQQGFVAGKAGVPVNGKQTMDPPDLRMHNLSDGFALVGVRSKPREIPSLNTQAAQLRNDEGTLVIGVNPITKAVNVLNTMSGGTVVVSVTNGTATVTANNGINLNGVTIDSSGNVVTPGDVTSKGTVLHTHVHSGVSTGSGDTGPPV